MQHTMYAEGGACHDAHNRGVGLVDYLVVLVDSNTLPSKARANSGKQYGGDTGGWQFTAPSDLCGLTDCRKCWRHSCAANKSAAFAAVMIIPELAASAPCKELTRQNAAKQQQQQQIMNNFCFYLLTRQNAAKQQQQQQIMKNFCFYLYLYLYQ